MRSPTFSSASMRKSQKSRFSQRAGMPLKPNSSGLCQLTPKTYVNREELTPFREGMLKALRHVLADHATRLDQGAIDEGMLKALRRGWCFGSEQFREALLEKLKSPESPARANCGRAITKSHDEREAGRLVAIGLAQLGIEAEDLRRLPKGSAEKIALATVVKQRTSVTNAWLAERLNMGAATRVSWNCGHASARRDVKQLIKRIEISIRKN